MFFRHEKPRTVTFEDYLTNLRQAGFAVQPEGSGRARISKHGCSAIVTDGGLKHPTVGKAGVIVGHEVGELVDGGYQKFFRTPTGVKVPALAEHLQALHNFQEDLKEGLGLISLYNESLGTTCDAHTYDRVKDRDHGVPRRAWEH